MFKEIKESLNKVKIMLVLSVMVFLLTMNNLNTNGVPLIIIGVIIYIYHMGIQSGHWGSQKQNMNTFIKDGLYKYIRHPIYLSIILIHLGVALCMNSWVYLAYTLALVTPYVYFHAAVEDELLKEKLPEYAESMKRTKMFIPYIL